jgi:hypothetical protein
MRFYENEKKIQEDQKYLKCREENEKWHKALNLRDEQERRKNWHRPWGRPLTFPTTHRINLSAVELKSNYSADEVEHYNSLGFDIFKIKEILKPNTAEVKAALGMKILWSRDDLFDPIERALQMRRYPYQDDLSGDSDDEIIVPQTPRYKQVRVRDECDLMSQGHGESKDIFPNDNLIETEEDGGHEIGKEINFYDLCIENEFKDNQINKEIEKQFSQTSIDHKTIINKIKISKKTL